MTFIDTADLSDYIGRDVTTDDGAIICVDAAIDTVQTLAEQDFVQVTTDTVRLSGTGTDTLLLPQLPVVAAGTVVENGGTLTAGTDYGVDRDGHLVRTDGTADWTTWTTGPTAYWPQGQRNIAVTYDHGWGTVPADIREVALALAARKITQGGATEETVGAVTRRYAASSTDLTNGERAILRKYRVAR